MSAWIPVQVTVGAPPRGGGAQSGATFKAQSFLGSFSWGSSPGTATIVYVGAAPLTAGCEVRIQLGCHYFAGLCRSDTVTLGSGGQTRTLEFVDYREFLTWDWAFCAFNKADVRLVNGVRVKRYKHMLPANYGAWTWTFTNGPLLAWEILEAILSYRALGVVGGVAGGTIGTPWSWDLTGNGMFPAGVLNAPVYAVDALEGLRLDAALNLICERLGVVFTLVSSPGDPFHLVFTRKGYGPLPDWAPRMDNWREGVALTGHATNICVLGGRNLYQVLDVPMAPDWSRAWEQFVSFERFADDIYKRDSDGLTGVRFNATPADPEQYIGRQKANARALEITVREYVALRNGAVAGEGDPFVDNRKFAGRWRMDMPAALYIQTLLFRAFRPDIAGFTNAAGRVIPLTSLDIADQLLCRVSHNAATGDMTAYPAEPVDGNGYAVVKGYQVGAELFKNIKSDQWNVDFFKATNRAWAVAAFQIDDSGEGQRFIIFDEPVIVSNNLLTAVNGQAVINANFTLAVPAVSAALVFEAERFQYWQGTYPNVSRDQVENVADLMAEYVIKGGGRTEILYANNQTSAQKAGEIATALLLRQYAYVEGGLKNIWDGKSDPLRFGTALSSMVDRVQIRSSATEGFFEVVDFTSERLRDYFEPERELDRRTLQNSLFPGQVELRRRAEAARALAASFRQMPFLARLLNRLLTGGLGVDQPLQLTWFSGGGLPGTAMPAGTVIRKTPTISGVSNGTNTVATKPDELSGADTVFVGVTVRDGEDAGRPFLVQNTGMALARVQGPVSVGDSVGLADGAVGWEYLVKDGPAVGVAKQEVAAEDVKLIWVMLGAGGGGAGGGVLPVWL